jgi:ABC-type nitrate/sulfonate/bicarbonate transport system ATPase subunit
MSIVIEHLNIAFAGKPVLRDLSLTLPDAGMVSIYGPSGCGKTTLLNCLAGFCRPDSGTICGMGGRRVSMVFQENRLLPWISALDNVGFVTGDNRQKAMTALIQMELAQVAGKRPGELSGGMQRRVAIARSLAFGGEVLLLDEPDTGLDQDLAVRVMQRLVIAWQGRLILLVTHDSALGDLFADEQYCFAADGRLQTC